MSALPRLRFLAALAGCAAMFGPAPSQTRPALKEPASVASEDGVLRVTLDAAPGKITLDGKTYPGEFYNDAYIPPVLRVKSGDKVFLHLANHLPKLTNLHMHGMNLSPNGNSDNIFIHILPGTSFDYECDIPVDLEQHPGLFWYHPHAHGFTNEQIIGGMSGGIIVEGAEKLFPFLENLPERVLLVKHIPRPDKSEVVSINGQINPSISIRPGEAQFWRIGNIGADSFLDLQISGMAFYVVATDGHWLSHPTKLDSMFLGPGARVEAVVIGGAPGVHPFISKPFREDNEQPLTPERRLATVSVEGAPAGDATAAEARVAAEKINGPRWIEAIRKSPIANRRTFTFTRNEARTQFFINGKMFDEARTDTVVKLGDTEEWTIRNEDDELHNFHFHQTNFLVTEINGVPRNADSLRDTITLPIGLPGKTGMVKLIIPFTDPTIVGRFVYHCHVVKHEDKGMMGTIEVRRHASLTE
jgi:FtsP/CotA-like multicopper oxidase with cupredoxin domain